MLKIRDVCSRFFSVPSSDDEHYMKIRELIRVQKEQWDRQTLNTLSSLVEPIKNELTNFTSQQVCMQCKCKCTHTEENQSWFFI